MGDASKVTDAVEEFEDMIASTRISIASIDTLPDFVVPLAR